MCIRDSSYTYYRFTVEELDGVLEKLETDEHKRNETKRKMKSFFNIYRLTFNQGSENVYNILSVLKYLLIKQFSITNNYCIPDFSVVYKHIDIFDRLKIYHALAQESI